jgi:hypothetical protein
MWYDENPVAHPHFLGSVLFLLTTSSHHHKSARHRHKSGATIYPLPFQPAFVPPCPHFAYSTNFPHSRKPGQTRHNRPNPGQLVSHVHLSRSRRPQKAKSGSEINVCQGYAMQAAAQALISFSRLIGDCKAWGRVRRRSACINSGVISHEHKFCTSNHWDYLLNSLCDLNTRCLIFSAVSEG